MLRTAPAAARLVPFTAAKASAIGCQQAPASSLEAGTVALASQITQITSRPFTSSRAPAASPVASGPAPSDPFNLPAATSKLPAEPFDPNGTSSARDLMQPGNLEPGFQPKVPDYAQVMKAAYEVSAEAQTPVPRGEVGMASGAPPVIYSRKVTICCPSQSPTQQGAGKTMYRSSAPAWKIEKDIVSGKWINPLMGWTSTADAMGDVDNAALWFYTREQAIAFVEKHGWQYDVVEPHRRTGKRQKRFAGYGDNFTVKRGGLPDLSHLDHMKEAAAADARGPYTAAADPGQGSSTAGGGSSGKKGAAQAGGAGGGGGGRGGKGAAATGQQGQR